MRRCRPILGVLLVAALVAIVVTAVYADRRGGPDRAAPNAVAALPSTDITLPPLRLPTGRQSVVLFGDSWAEGVDARPRTKGWAYLVGRRLGTRFSVYGSGGTGYTNPGTQGAGTFPKRMATLVPDPSVSLVVIEGGVNDLSATGPTNVTQAVTDTVTTARRIYSQAQIVVFGVMPLSLDVQGLRQLSSQIGYAATQAGAYFVSPVNNQWLDAQTVTGFLNRDNNHPTTAGHALIADRVVQSLQVLAKNGQTTTQ